MASKLPDTNWNILEALKTKIREARVKAVVSANVQLLGIYCEIGQTITTQKQQQGWGAKVVDQLTSDQKAEFPDFKELLPRNLQYTREFSLGCQDLNLAAGCCNNGLFSSYPTSCWKRREK